MRKLIFILLNFGLILLFPFNKLLCFNNLHFESITERNGLSQNTVRCMLQDKTGFMWFGTINGLNRYNGKEFNIMQPEESNRVTLSDNRIRSLYEDDFGYIWIWTVSKTFNCYNPRTERFINYIPENLSKNYSYLKSFSNGDIWLYGKDGCCRIRHLDRDLQSRLFTDRELGNNEVSFVHEDNAKNIWIGSTAGVFCLTPDEQLIKMTDEVYKYMFESNNQLFLLNNEHLKVIDSKQPDFKQAEVYPLESFGIPVNINQATLTRNGHILLATKQEVIIFDTSSKRFIQSDPFFAGEKVQNANLITDNKGNKWLYNFSGNLWRQLKNGHFKKYELIPKHILATIDLERYEIFHDSHDNIWITTYGNGLCMIDRDTEQAFHFTTKNSEISSNYLLSITEDKSGQIWIGTEFSGLNKVSLSDYPIQIFYPDSEDLKSRDNSVRMIYQDRQKRYWIGSRSGSIHIYDAAFKTLKTFTTKGGLPFCAKEDEQGNIWVGTRGNGLMVFSPNFDKPIRKYELEKVTGTSGDDNVFDLTFDEQGRVWVATFGGGLFYADVSDIDNITFHKMDLNTQNRTRAIVTDHTGRIWVGTNEGILTFYPEEFIRDNTKFHQFQYDNKDEKTLRNNEIKAILEDSRNQLWFGTTGGGLNLLIQDKDNLGQSWFKHYTSQHGLSNNVIQSIQEDLHGNIWVSTEGGSGISKFIPKEERFENYSFASGDQLSLFNEASSWKNEHNELMFGSFSGIFIFDPAKIKYDTYTPPIVITGLKINGNNVLPDERNSPLAESITFTKSIRITHTQNSFNIEFAMLNFLFSDINQYQYILEGYEKDWNTATRHNVAAYRNIPPGFYKFKVKGANSSGIWTDSETMLEIKISPPLWKTSWAYMIYICLLSVIIFSVIKVVLHIHKLHTAVEVEKQLTDYKLRFFTNISHEFRTPLTIIKGTMDSLTDSKNVPEVIRKQITQMGKSTDRLLRLIEQLLEFRKLQNKGLVLDIERTEAVGFFYDIFLTFKEVTDKKNIELQFESNYSHYNMLLDKSKFDKILYNLLSNAIKNTPPNGIIITKLFFSEFEDQMILSVSDSGPGVPKEKQDSLFVRFAQISTLPGGTGVGLHLIAELAAVHKGKIIYSSSEELGGACFTVSIPLSDTHYFTEQLTSSQLQAQQEPNLDEVHVSDDGKPVIVDDRYKDYNILIIEDDDDVREFITTQLSAHFKVIAAKNGEEGMTSASDQQPDLIICDVMMPGISGIEVTKNLNKDFNTSHIPIILLTAHSSESSQLEGVQAGADAYITKPFSLKYLLLKIIQLIEQREKLREKFSQEPGTLAHLIATTDRDKEFLNTIDKLIEKNMNNVDFSVTDMFTQTTKMGRTTFYKKLKGITGYSPNVYLRVIRIKKAAELLLTTELNISEISYEVGINDPLYFSKCFKTQFGKTPSEFRKS